MTPISSCSQLVARPKSPIFATRPETKIFWGLIWPWHREELSVEVVNVPGIDWQKNPSPRCVDPVFTPFAPNRRYQDTLPARPSKHNSLEKQKNRRVLWFVWFKNALSFQTLRISFWSYQPAFLSQKERDSRGKNMALPRIWGILSKKLGGCSVGATHYTHFSSQLVYYLSSYTQQGGTWHLTTNRDL